MNEEEKREEYKKDETVRISYNDIIILATSRALKHYPIMNSTLVGEEILLHDSVNMGIAVASPEGLIVPVLRSMATTVVVPNAQSPLRRTMCPRLARSSLTLSAI